MVLITGPLGPESYLSTRLVKPPRPDPQTAKKSTPMTTSTVERAYALARSGKYANLKTLKEKLKAENCRAVDALLAPRSISGHLSAICAATFKGALVD